MHINVNTRMHTKSRTHVFALTHTLAHASHRPRDANSHCPHHPPPTPPPPPLQPTTRVQPAEQLVRFIRVTFGGTAGCTTGCGPYAVANVLAQRIDATFSRLFYNESDKSTNARGLNLVCGAPARSGALASPCTRPARLAFCPRV
jgi:hypothetical protein